MLGWQALETQIQQGLREDLEERGPLGSEGWVLGN